MMAETNERRATIHTIGYGNRRIDDFTRLLKQQAIVLLCDIRSQPYSRFRPEFAQGPLARALEQAGIRYFFMGKELGGRPRDSACYIEGRLSYRLVAEQPIFQQGLAQVRELAGKMPLALMCAEADPVGCHRAILVARHLRRTVADIRHIGADGAPQQLTDFERALVERHGLAPPPLLDTPEAWAAAVEAAYDRQGAKMTGAV